jgi:hypothetical protein
MSDYKKALENYVYVKDRVKQFREDHADYGIITEMVQHEPGISATFKCTITNEQARVLSVGHAHDKTSDNTSVNITSLVENCETSAVGRALAFLGYGIDKAIASREEVKHLEPKPFTGTPAQLTLLRRCLRTQGIKDQEIANQIHAALKEDAVNDDELTISNYIKGFKA